jgi:hypothetical protein
MDHTVIFLDDVHTRGTDLKLPSDYRAAVTLGPALVKDKLVQGKVLVPSIVIVHILIGPVAAMRMRKLGHGQSLTFFAPPEIDRKIREINSLSKDVKIQAKDVIQWVLGETCASTEKSVPLWANQGLSYQVRQAAWEEYEDEGSSRTRLREQIVEQDAQTLEELYSPRPRTTQPAVPWTAPVIRHANVQSINEYCQSFGHSSSSLRGVRQQEEQEREILQEVELERQVERAPKVSPSTHSLHQDLVHFVESGDLRLTGEAFTEAFSSLCDTTVAEHIRSEWTPRLVVTSDFARTIADTGAKDQYLRPVNWILSSASGTLVVISPFEANKLLPYLWTSSCIKLHVYSPKVTKHMPTLDSLTFCAIPNAITTQIENLPILPLNLFAGQLYFRDFAEYTKLCKMLGLHLSTEGDDRVETDGFVLPQYRSELNIAHSAFTASPIPLLRCLAGYRRKGMDYSETHLGQILKRRLLREKDF